MKIKNISMAVVAAAAMLAVCPAVHAQTETNSTSGAARASRGRGPTLESIDKAVTLTDAQKPKVKAALEDYMTAMTSARDADQSERRTKMTAARDDFNKKMKEILTPEQYTKFEAMPRPGRRGATGGGGTNPGGAGNSPAGN